ncbi:hypothetical protein MUP46_04680 [Patescibacteria group bacterium]|nr:hypothetical protein [Patescibacteria group bacterium]
MVIKIRTQKRPAFPDWRGFISCFCETDKQIDQCMDILQIILDHNNDFSARNWKVVKKSSVGMYTKCLRILIDGGLIEKASGQYGHYSLSRELVFTLEAIIGRWTYLVDSVESGRKLSLKKKRLLPSDSEDKDSSLIVF